ncbi:acetylglutamate kinase [Buchnera aphidicola (Mindarus keteleerifoliae)]|uniref:acetylglutamate kinase n=1 Tax=Buchnera aphidicola TaxID=9 RepID=UPI0031B6CF05
MNKNPLVIKLGGLLLDSEEAMNRLFKIFVSYRNLCNRKIIIVHGGGGSIDNLMKRLSLPIKKKQGLRITPIDHIKIITGVLSGTVNKMLLAWTKKYNIDAVGLCLTDGNSTYVTQLSSSLGYVGTAKPRSSKFLKLILSQNMIPIISSIGITEDGILMNVNSDIAATAISLVLDADLILLSDISSIIDGKGKPITKIDFNLAHKLINRGIITDGMIVKVKAALEAAQTLNKIVDIASWQNEKELKLLFKGKSIGTQVLPN